MNKITTIYDKPLNDNNDWELTKKQYNSIHNDFKGIIDGQYQALRMINGGTQIVNVKIIG
jgi:hypothetical protein